MRGPIQPYSWMSSWKFEIRLLAWTSSLRPGMVSELQRPEVCGRHSVVAYDHARSRSWYNRIRVMVLFTDLVVMAWGTVMSCD